MSDIKISSIDEAFLGTTIPASVTIELLTRCNLRCVHCYINDYSHRGLPVEHLNSLFKKLRKLGTYRLNFTGGEIFLYDNILDLIRMARQMGFSVNLLSNATLLDDNLIKKLSNMRISSFGTTVFSMSDKVHDSITSQKGSLIKTLKSVENLKKHGITVEIKTPIMEANKTSYYDVFSFSRENNFGFSPSVTITPKLNGEMTPINLNLKGNDLNNAIIFLRENNFLNSGKNMKDNLDDYICTDIRNEIFINSQGDIFPCINYLDKLGNIYSDDIDDVCNSKKRFDIINLRKSEFKNCTNCKLAISCLPCPGLTLLETGYILSCSSSAKRMAKIEYRLLKGG